MQPIDHRYIAGVGLVALAVATRLFPHPANFTAVGAVALVAGGYLGWRWAAGVSLGAMLLSDIFLGFYHLPVMVAVYGSLLMAVAIGRWVCRGAGSHWTRVVAGSLGASVLFYLITNWAVWRFTPLYPKTGVGLLAAYVAALPFFRHSLMGDLFYAGLLLGALEVARWWRAKFWMFPRSTFTIPTKVTLSPRWEREWEGGEAHRIGGI